MVTLIDRKDYYDSQNGTKTMLADVDGVLVVPKLNHLHEPQQATKSILEAISEQDIEQWKITEEFKGKLQGIEDGLDLFIDDVAKTRKYGTIHMSPTEACLAYAGYDNQYMAEAETFGQWKSSIWPIVFKIQADYLEGKREEPTLKIIISELPLIVWPSN